MLALGKVSFPRAMLGENCRAARYKGMYKTLERRTISLYRFIRGHSPTCHDSVELRRRIQFIASTHLTPPHSLLLNHGKYLSLPYIYFGLILSI